MLKKIKLICSILLLTILLISCEEKVQYPIYSLTKISYVPDSLKVKHREFVKETVRAASQQMTGGDYEDVDETIIQAKHTADELFQVSVIGLRKDIDENYWNAIELTPEEMNPYEKKILDSLSNSH